jgi:hypothetical protein
MPVSQAKVNGRVLVAGLFVLALVACSSSSGNVSAPNPQGNGTPPPEEDGGTEVETPPAADACGAVKKSKCKPANEGSVVRGVVKFDPSKVKASATTALRVFLHHQYVANDAEEKLGGHPHAYKSYDVDMEKGEARFSLDLCEFGTAMWSEENCGFNIVAMIDDDGKNDPDLGPKAMIPRAGKLVKMAPVEVSCHKTSPCLEITADCVEGEGCTTFKGLKECACAADSCPSDDAVCKR